MIHYTLFTKLTMNKQKIYLFWIGTESQNIMLDFFLSICEKNTRQFEKISEIFFALITIFHVRQIIF